MVTNILLVAILVGLAANWLEQRKARSGPQPLYVPSENADADAKWWRARADEYKADYRTQKEFNERLMQRLLDLAKPQPPTVFSDDEAGSGDPMSVTEADRASAEQDRLARELERARRGPFAGGRSPSRTDDDEAPGLHRAEAAATGEFDESDPAYEREQESGS